MSAEQGRGDTGILRTKSEMKWIKIEKEKEANEVDINYLKHQLKDFNILNLQNDEGFNKLEALYKVRIVNVNFDPLTDMK